MSEEEKRELLAKFRSILPEIEAEFRSIFAEIKADWMKWHAEIETEWEERCARREAKVAKLEEGLAVAATELRAARADLARWRNNGEAVERLQ